MKLFTKIQAYHSADEALINWIKYGPGNWMFGFYIPFIKGLLVVTITGGKWAWRWSR